MLIDIALAHYNGSSRALAQALGVSVQAVSQWKGRGRLPELRARQLQEITHGKLRFDRAAYLKRLDA
jgi:DNA-binding transcriptional regulator YdaS (Cro superfamily)